MEFKAGFSPRPHASHAIFDFDGTLSGLRHGWPELMCEVFLPYYPMRPDESKVEVRRELLTENSFHQWPACHRAGGKIRATCSRPTGKRPRATLGFASAECQDRLDENHCRTFGKEILQKRADAPMSLSCLGARTMLSILHQRGIKLSVLSGTLECRVKEESGTPHGLGPLL